MKQFEQGKRGRRPARLGAAGAVQEGESSFLLVGCPVRCCCCLSKPALTRPASPCALCRDALASAPKPGQAHRRIPPNKKTYQQDPANYREVGAGCLSLTWLFDWSQRPNQACWASLCMPYLHFWLPGQAFPCAVHCSTCTVPLWLACSCRRCARRSLTSRRAPTS